MEFPAFRQMYHNLIAAVTETRIVSLAAGGVLEDFPGKLDLEAQVSVYTAFQAITADLKRAISDDIRRIDVESEKFAGEKFGPLSFNIVSLFFARHLAGIAGEKTLEVGSLLYAQEIVMLLAHLDAFMIDTIKVMCVREPRILRRKKKMDWSDILDAGGWDALMDALIESYAYELGWKSIRERVGHLSTEHGLRIDFPADELDELDAVENLRHIIIHNGSRVSSEYLARTGRSDVAVGEFIRVDAAFAQDVSWMVSGLASSLFQAVAEKFFDVPPEELSGMIVRRTPAGWRSEARSSR
jgi:hypothetical protein